MKIKFLDWKDTLKSSILEHYSFLNKEDDISNILLNTINVLGKAQLRYGKKEVLLSKELKQNSRYEKFKKEIEEIKISFENNQFKLIEKRLSNDHQKSIINKDTMLDILDIEHFHLAKEKDCRTKELLFVKYSKIDNKIYFIDIFDHNSFFNKEIIEIIHNNWQEVLLDLKLNNNATINKLKNKYYYLLQNKYATNCIYPINDNPETNYFTYGIMSNKTAIQDYTKVQIILRDIEYFYQNKLLVENKLKICMNKNFNKIKQLKVITIWEYNKVRFKEIYSNTYIELLDNNKCHLYTLNTRSVN